MARCSWAASNGDVPVLYTKASRGSPDPLADSCGGGYEGSRASEGLAEGGDEHGRLDLMSAGVASGSSCVGEEAKAVGLVEVQAAVIVEVGS
jgi:hypothetical protein